MPTSSFVGPKHGFPPRARSVLALLTIAVALAASSVESEGRTTYQLNSSFHAMSGRGGGKRPCAADRQRLCGATASKRSCQLIAYIDQVSPQCRVAIARHFRAKHSGKRQRN